MVENQKEENRDKSESAHGGNLWGASRLPKVKMSLDDYEGLEEENLRLVPQCHESIC